MLCDDCGRHEAVVHITQIGPNGRVEKNLCEACAAGYSEFAGVPHQDKRNVSVDDFLRASSATQPCRRIRPPMRRGNWFVPAVA